VQPDLVSPELALVDPELAARARRSLPEPDCLSRFDRPAPVPPPERRFRSAIRSPRLARNALVLVVCASVVLNVDLLVEGGAPPPASDRPTERAAVEKTTPRYGVSAAQRRLVKPQPHPSHRGTVRSRKAVEPSSATLRWPEAPSAIEYDLVIWRGHDRVLDVWRRKPELDLADLPCADARKLRPGARYLWFAYPLIRRTGPHRFGPLLKWGVFHAGHACARASLSKAR
jgi:hypothetical protein